MGLPMGFLAASQAHFEILLHMGFQTYPRTVHRGMTL